MVGEGVAPLTQERQVTENPCCDCEQSGMSMTCRCKDRRRYDFSMLLREAGKSEEEIAVWLEQA